MDAGTTVKTEEIEIKKALFRYMETAKLGTVTSSLAKKAEAH